MSRWKERYWDEFNLVNHERKLEVFGDENHGLYYSALDSIQDMCGALYMFSIIERLPSQLECLGFMQALVILQDAVEELAKILDVDWRPSQNENLCNLRDIRNRVTGHPVLKNRGSSPSTSFFTSSNISKYGFHAVVQFKGRWEDTHINFETAIKQTDDALVGQMEDMFSRVLELKERMICMK